MSAFSSGIGGNREFPSTTPSVIFQAGDPSSPEHARHLARLVELYWRPIYCVIRQAWAKSDDDAKDLTQEFFATVILDRSLLATYVAGPGGFRILLRTAITRFMHDVARTARRQKRGGGAAMASLEQIGVGVVEAIPGAERMAPDEIFDAAWNEMLMSRALGLLEQKLTAEGKAVAFALFRQYDFEGDSAELSYDDLGREFSLSKMQVKRALAEARSGFREIVTDLVGGYVDNPRDLAAELRSLFG